MSASKPVPSTTITRDVRNIDEQTGNLYESLVVIAKRANQISTQTKDELNAKLSEFITLSDNLEEVFENKEQIEISKHYEKLPKATLIATEEFLGKKVYFRNPHYEKPE